MPSEQNLIEFLKQHKPAEKFTPYSHRDGNSLTVYFKGDADYSEYISPNLSIMRSIDTKEVVGVRIDGIPPEFNPERK